MDFVCVLREVMEQFINGPKSTFVPYDKKSIFDFKMTIKGKGEEL